MMLDAIATTTTGHAPADIADVKTAHLPMKPAVSGIPAIESSKNANAPGLSGDVRPRPGHRAQWVGSSPPTRMTVTIAKATIIAKP